MISAEEKLHSENPFLRRNQNEEMNWRFIPFSRCADGRVVFRIYFRAVATGTASICPALANISRSVLVSGSKIKDLPISRQVYVNELCALFRAS